MAFPDIKKPNDCINYCGARNILPGSTKNDDQNEFSKEWSKMLTCYQNALAFAFKIRNIFESGLKIEGYRQIITETRCSVSVYLGKTLYN